MLPDFERADRIGEFWSYPESRTFAELLTDCEEDRSLRAVLVSGAPSALQETRPHATGPRKGEGAGDRVTRPLRRLPAIRPISAYVFLGWSRLPTCEEPHSARPVQQDIPNDGEPRRVPTPTGSP